MTMDTISAILFLSSLLTIPLAYYYYFQMAIVKQKNLIFAYSALLIPTVLCILSNITSTTK